MLFQLPIHSTEKVTDVYLNKLTSNGFIIAIPEIHWSTLFITGKMDQRKPTTNIFYNH